VPLLSLEDVSVAYGHVSLLSGADFRIDRGERVCVVGRNGAGKSTLFRIIAGAAEPDAGRVWRADTLRISHLLQEVPSDDQRTVYDVVAAGLGETGRLLAAYHAAAQRQDLRALQELQQDIEARHGWNPGQRIDTALSRLDLPPDAPLARCSGGTRRRVLLAQALVSDPDLLLLDEPTNHMDIAAIGWLEEYLLAWRGALMFITHDRTLARNLATRIVELDRGRLRSWPGDFVNFLRRKDELLDAELNELARLDRRLAEEEAWIRQGIKARRTRNEGRVRRLGQLRRERAARPEQPGQVQVQPGGVDASGRLVVDLRHVRFAFGDRIVIRDFSTRILRGDRVGIVGPNGCGKSTLLRLLLGELQPQSGTITRGARLEIGYFDQHRAQLDPERSVRENISPGSDYVTVRGRPRHVIGYLRDFLFPYQRADSPVKSLSGGERNRLLLARTFTRAANLLVLDEPTNDLDVDTLELLEDLLADYDGTLLLVSHDRTFLDNVVTSIIGFEGDGRIAEYVGGYEDWVRQRPAPAPHPARAPAAVSAPPASPREVAPRRLSYHEQRELAGLPQVIETLEREQTALEAEVSSPAFYRRERETIAASLQRLEDVRRRVQEAYARWERLETAAANRGRRP
jgi:ATP-binding cassette subfamily F protein uup